jgi:uncharacterized membrane protein
LRRLAGYLLLAGASSWAALASARLASLSPVLWPLIAPWLLLTGIAAFAAAATAAALLGGSRAAGRLALVFALSLAPALLVTLWSPLPLR